MSCVLLSLMLRRKNVLGSSPENTEELDRASEMKEREAALCLEFLLQNEANPSIQDKDGYNTVHYAAAYGHRQCLELWLDALAHDCHQTSENSSSQHAEPDHGFSWSKFRLLFVLIIVVGIVSDL
uniref:Uncharacterized protein n=1 Tax=Sphaerodactylus townsendi TaxID=933632 RepID=A0ACB8FZH4_9SAUR